MLGRKQRGPDGGELAHRHHHPRLVEIEAAFAHPVPHRLHALRRPQHLADLLHHQGLDRLGRQAAEVGGARPEVPILGRRVVPVALALLGRAGRDQPLAAGGEQQSAQQRQAAPVRSHRRAPFLGGLGQHVVGGLPLGAGQDRRVLAQVVATLVDDLAEVHAVVQQLVNRLLAEGAARLGADAFGRVVAHHVGGRAIAGEVGEDAPHHRRLRLVDDEQAVLHVVTERQRPAHPHALGLAGSDLVANALAGDLALELGEGQQHVQHQPPHRGGRVDLLGNRAEAHTAAVEHFHHAREVGERAVLTPVEN